MSLSRPPTKEMYKVQRDVCGITKTPPTFAPCNSDVIVRLRWRYMNCIAVYTWIFVSASLFKVSHSRYNEEWDKKQREGYRRLYPFYRFLSKRRKNIVWDGISFPVLCHLPDAFVLFFFLFLSTSLYLFLFPSLYHFRHSPYVANYIVSSMSCRSIVGFQWPMDCYKVERHEET